MTNIVAISDARANLPNLVNKVNKGLERVLITVNGKPRVAVVSLEELESLEETAEVLSTPGAKESIARGLKEVKKKQGILLSKL